ncbi:hypothetical protein CAP35_08990 [Chitinophagaceae bacterium IBVUCB1]|nr:hypothetical protein CAP35_08990 [Chitinophagaceae bacterium IBVUCB1]
MLKAILYSVLLSFCFVHAIAQNANDNKPKPLRYGHDVVVGAERTDKYLPLLKDKKVALLINQTSNVANVSLLDTLLRVGVNVVKVFVPEHGFRGEAEAGAKVDDGTDSITKLPIISLYGDNKKPKAEQLTDVDVLIYDLQDVGVRFYTYISTMQYAMEACIENKKKFIILDRPNPNGHYVDGPVLKPEYKSFVGMQPIPVIYGMTVGEYAKMLAGEKWVSGADKLDMKVITCANYDHLTQYDLPVRPSPNLKTMAAVLAYPSVCLFEGTVVSVGRGTSTPFQMFGHPDFSQKASYSFRPVPVWGKPEPLYAYKDCFGQMIAMDKQEVFTLIGRQLRLHWLIRAYSWYPDKKKFFNPFFEKLIGNGDVRKQIESGATEYAIAARWKPEVAAFKKIRKKYLLYPDFE